MGRHAMPGNRAVAYMGPGRVEVQTIDYPGLELRDGPGVNPANVGRKCPHGVILKVVATNICGSDQHMVRGRTTAPQGLVLGHEITGEVVEAGPGVEFIKVGDQAEYVMVPYADFNALKFPDRDQAMEKIRDLTMLSDIFPTGYHGARTAGVTTGSTVYVAGAGPVGLACAHSAQLLGAAVVIVGDMNADRLKQAQTFGCETIDLTKDASLGDQIEQILGEPEVDAAVDCVGFEARGHGAGAGEAPATVLNTVMTVAKAGGGVGIPGLYVTGDPGGIDEDAKIGSLRVRLGLGWAKSHYFTTGQCPVMMYHRGLMMAILNDRAHIADAVNATVIPLDRAPEGYREFDSGVARKYVIDPHGMIAP